MGTNNNQSKADDISKVYLFSGLVDSRRQSAVAEILAQVVNPDFADFDLEKFDGDTASAENIITAAMTVPFASERKTVIVDRVDKLAANDQARIAETIPKLGPRSCLILLADEDSSAQQKSRSASKATEQDDSEAEEVKPQKTRKGLQPELVKAVRAHGELVTFGKLNSTALASLVKDAVAAHGKKIEPSALQALSQSLSANPAAIGNEVGKLAAYAGDRDTITSEDVDKVATKSPEDRVFPLIDAVAAGRADQAIQLINETFAASARPDSEVPRILSLLGRHFRLLYQTRFLKTRGIRMLDSAPEELQSMLMQDRRQNPVSVADWQQRKLLAQASAFTLEELRNCLKQVLACELAVKGLGTGDGSPRLNLELLVMRLTRDRRKR